MNQRLNHYRSAALNVARDLATNEVCRLAGVARRAAEDCVRHGSPEARLSYLAELDAYREVLRHRGVVSVAA